MIFLHFSLVSHVCCREIKGEQLLLKTNCLSSTSIIMYCVNCNICREFRCSKFMSEWKSHTPRALAILQYIPYIVPHSKVHCKAIMHSLDRYIRELKYFMNILKLIKLSLVSKVVIVMFQHLTLLYIVTEYWIMDMNNCIVYLLSTSRVLYV